MFLGVLNSTITRKQISCKHNFNQMGVLTTTSAVASHSRRALLSAYTSGELTSDWLIPSVINVRLMDRYRIKNARCPYRYR
jgi:hypothetical protein